MRRMRQHLLLTYATFYIHFSVPLHTQDYRCWEGREAYTVSTSWSIKNWHLEMECLAAFDLKLNRFLFIRPILLIASTMPTTLDRSEERCLSKIRGFTRVQRYWITSVAWSVEHICRMRIIVRCVEVCVYFLEREMPRNYRICAEISIKLFVTEKWIADDRCLIYVNSRLQR